MQRTVKGMLFAGLISNIGECWLQFGGEALGKLFQFDLDSLQRNYTIENPDTDLCSNAGERGRGGQGDRRTGREGERERGREGERERVREGERETEKQI